jgi:hypothetical protein
LDLLEITDTSGEKYRVLNMVCLGTCFQQAEVVKIGAGQASSRDCLNSFARRWVAWAVRIVCDRGLHNRGVFQQYIRMNAAYKCIMFHWSAQSLLGGEQNDMVQGYVLSCCI